MAAFSGSNLTPSGIAAAEFPTSFRGYDTEAVRDFLNDVSTLISELSEQSNSEVADSITTNQLRELKKENLRLRSKLKAGTSNKAVTQSGDLSDDQVASALGREATRILEAARAAAAEIVDKANDDSDDIKSNARREGDKIISNASDVLESKRVEADREAAKTVAVAEKQATEIRNIAQTEYDRVRSDVSKAMTEAKRVLKNQEKLSNQKADQVVADAEVYRKEILSTTLKQRRTGSDELSALLETRDALASSLSQAQRNLDALVVDLDEVNSRPPTVFPDNHFEQELAQALEDLEAKAPQILEDPEALNDVQDSLDKFGLAKLEVGSLEPTVTQQDLDRVEIDLREPKEKSIEDFIDLDIEAEAPVAEKVAAVKASEKIEVDRTESGIVVQFSDTDPVNTAVLEETAEPTDTFSDYEGHWDSVITTVSGRSYGTAVDETRGDLPSMEIMPDSVPEIFKDRDVALARLGPELRRQMKRALNDDQNDVLDRIRRGTGNPSVSELPSNEEQIQHYFDPLRASLGAVADSAAEIADGEADLVAIDSIALQMARHLVLSLRIPMIDKIEKSPDSDRELLSDAIRSIYRDYRNALLVPLLEDALFEVYAIGHFMALDQNAETRWLVDPRLEPDPLCEINSRTNGLKAGDIYPSGHNYPLSLPGCRCLLVSVD